MADGIGIEKYLPEWAEVTHLREVMTLQLEAAEKARQIQAEEYERRLSMLNHEAEQLKNIQATYVPREVFENWAKDLGTKLDKVLEAQTRSLPREIHEAYIKANDDKMAALSRLVYIGMGILIVVELVVRFFLK